MDAQDVAVGVAKPGLTEVSSGRDVILGLDLREAVLFEAHATAAQLVDDDSQVGRCRPLTAGSLRGGPCSRAPGDLQRQQQMGVDVAVGRIGSNSASDM